MKTISPLLCILQGIVFVGLLLYSNLGVEASKWAVPQYILNGDKSALNSFQTLQYYEASQRAKKRIGTDKLRVMYFHPEPGAQVSLYLDRSYFWQDVHYAQTPWLKELCYMETRDEILTYLKRNRIGVIVLSGIGYRTYMKIDGAHRLIRMLDEHDAEFEFDPPFVFVKAMYSPNQS